MVLPSTGNLISFNQIRIELGVAGATGFNLGGAAGGAYNAIQNCESPFPNATDPDAINEWWSYDHSKQASSYATGDIGESCQNVCNSLPGIPCDKTVYAFSGVYYFNPVCTDKVGQSLGTSFLVDRIDCSSGASKNGRPCYEFNSNGELINTTTCTQCGNLGDPCAVNNDCCAPLTCGSGLTCTDQGD
jgi:hypothetical protein